MNEPAQPTPPHAPASDALFERIGRLPFTGRQPQLRVIEHAVRSACSGEGSVIILSGEAGIGKSRLLHEARRLAIGGGATALKGECIAEPGAPPYFVWINALRGLDDQTVRHLLEGSASPENSTPYSSWRSRKMTVEEARFRLYSDVVGALERASRRQPMLIALDDLQWSDLPSLQLLRFVAHHVHGLPLLLLGAMRTEDLAPGSPLRLQIDELEATHKTLRVEVPPFAFSDTQAVVTGLLGSESGDVARLLNDHCEGNPFVLEETVRLLVTSSAHGLGLVLRGVPPPLPSSVSASIKVRLDRLSDGEREAIDVAAIQGKVFDLRAVAHALRSDEHQVEALLDRLVGLAMLRPVPPGQMRSGSYAFLHDRVRETVLDVMTPTLRKTLHQRVATALKADPLSDNDPNTVAALANHCRQAGSDQEAAGYFSRLGDLSLQRHAPEEAAAAYQAAIDLQQIRPPGSEAIAALEMKLGNALLVSGKIGAVQAYSRAARAFRDAGALREAGAAAGQQGLALANAEQHDQALATYQQALNLLAPAAGSDRERASVLLHMSETLGPSLARYDDALRAQRQAMTLLDPHNAGDPLRSVASLALARTLMRMNRLADAQQVLEEALPATIRLGELSVAADLEGARANVTYWLGDVRQSRICTLQRQAHAHAAGDEFNTRHFSSWLAHLEIALGNWAEAERLLGEAGRDVSGFYSPEPVAFTRQISAHLAFVRGDYASARDQMLDALRAFRQMGAATVLWYMGYAARASFAAGDRETSEALANETLILLEELPPTALSRGASLTQLALLAIESGQDEQLGMLYDRLFPFAGELHWNLVDRALGMVAASRGRHALACRHLDEAIAAARRFGLRPELALAVAERASIAGDDLEPSIARLRSMGLEGDARQLQTQFDRLRASTRSANPASLTDREVEVMRLLAAGLTNREIGGQLGISEKTVTNHITHIFDKAGLENRAAAAAFAVRHHLD